MISHTHKNRSVVGYSKHVKKYIERGERGQFQQLFGKNYGDIQIDFDCKIFQSLYGVDVDDIELIN